MFEDCITTQTRAAFDERDRIGQHPPPSEARPAPHDLERERQHAVRQERLRRLRDSQAAASRAQEQGRLRWRPRYEKAARELRKAEADTRTIVDKMRRHGCRTDSLACGGLPTKLEKARRIEAKKRDYLENTLVDECRRSGCQPGWLR